MLEGKLQEILKFYSHLIFHNMICHIFKQATSNYNTHLAPSDLPATIYTQRFIHNLENTPNSHNLPNPQGGRSRHSRVGGIHRVGCGRHRHCGLDPQSRGVADVRATTRQNNHIPPSPLMGEESKVRVTARKPQHCVIPSKARNLGSRNRHTGFKAVSTGWQGDTGEQEKPTIFPLSLDGRGIKGEGDSKKTPNPNPNT